MTDLLDLDPEALLRRGDEDDEPRYTNFYRREPNLLLRETNDSAIIRPLMESKDWFRALTHPFVAVTKAAPEGHEGNWPKGLSTTCRKDGNLKRFYPDGCPVCMSPLRTKFDKSMEESAKDLRFTLAVEREEVVGDGSIEMGGPEALGKKGYADKMIEVPVWDENGNAVKDQFVKRPSIVIVSGSMFQMFGSLKALGETYQDMGGLRGRDFKVKRIPNPSGRNGDIYMWAPLSPVDSIAPGTAHWATYDEAIKAWTPKGLSLARTIIEKSADAFYERFFTTNGVLVMPAPKPAQATSGFAVPSGTTAPSVAAPAAAPDPDKLAAMAARIMKQPGVPAQAEPSPES